jgi:predicted RND superfamily exporter protein
MLGQWTSLKIRLYLSVAGLLGISMGMVIALGLTSVMGFPYTDIHSILPFLYLAIGIDDIFVIVQCWTNLRLDESTPIPEKMGLALQRVGVSITVTSLTDVFAFGIGALSWMPGVASFCICAALGLAAIFLLQVSWFVAWMSLDEARVAAGRDGVLPCVVLAQGSRGKGCTTDNHRRWTLGTIYRYLLSSSLFKALIIAVTIGIFGAGTLGCTLMRVKFDWVQQVPSDSYLSRLEKLSREFREKTGGDQIENWKAYIYSETVDHSHLASIDRMVTGLEQLQEEGILKKVDSWWAKMKEYVEDKANSTNWRDFDTEDKFQLLLSDFLFSSLGAKYRTDFKFDSPLECNHPAPRVIASKFAFRYSLFDVRCHHSVALLF